MGVDVGAHVGGEVGAHVGVGVGVEVEVKQLPDSPVTWVDLLKRRGRCEVAAGFYSARNSKN